MIQLQALNYILDKKDTDMLQLYDEKYYKGYEEIYNAILDHYNKFKNIPDKFTILEKFNDFDVFDVNESRQYLEVKLYEEFVKISAITTINSSSEDFMIDPVKACTKLIAQLSEIKPPTSSHGVDIIQNAIDRYNKFIDKQSNSDNYIFSTGLVELDMSIGGLQRGEELIVVFARTNNCKSWISEKLAVSVWEAGYNVGFFSPEMTPDSVGYRFDTLYKNFDNKGIQGFSPDFNSSKYKTYIDKLHHNKNVFSVTTPTDFNRHATVSAIKKWIVELDLKMVVIDGATYMANERAGGRKNTTENLTDISEDLMTLSVELGIPIVLVVQANRAAARDNNGDVSAEAPELDTIRGSDGISHNASKVISVVHRQETLMLYVNKNRNGAVGQKLIYNYDVNNGKFTYIDNPKSGLAIDTSETGSCRDDYNDNDEVF